MARSRAAWIAVGGMASVGVTLLALAGSGLLRLPHDRVATAAPGGRTFAPPAIGGAFRLTSHKGETVTNESLRGKPYAIFFGYTHCPDVCPTTLFDLATLLEELGPDGNKVTPVLVTVDPERDTREVLAEYMQAFDPRILALTGSGEAVEATLKAFKVFRRKVPSEGGYAMDHSALVYLMDKEGRFFSTLDPHEDRSARLAKLRRAVTR
jgi:protein SCO1/2